MRSVYAIFALTLLGLVLPGLSQDARACVETHPDSTVVTVYGDSLCNTYILISNLRLAGGAPNEFCSCGITQFLDGYTIDYVVFVDSTTHQAIEGFDLFQYSNDASESWEDTDPNTIDWNGFVANVNQAGLFQDHPVSLLIRASVPNLPECVLEPEVLYWGISGLGFGTDAFDVVNGVLADHHQDITYIEDISHEIIVETVSPQFFVDLDDWYYNVVNNTNGQEMFEVTIFPNPTSGVLTIQSSSDEDVVISNLQGTVVLKGRITSPFGQLDVSLLSAGTYIINLTNNKATRVYKIVIQ